ncbi:MAG: hypothetical protein RBJ76_13455 [Stenomitos frigidus ULC029]
MFKSLFFLTASLTFTTLVAGILAAALTGSDKAFEPKPVVAAARTAWHWVTKAANNSNKNSDDDFADVASSAAAKVQKRLENVGKHPDTVKSVPGTATTGNALDSDPRLAICRHGSVEPKALKEIPLTVATALKARYSKGDKFSFLDLQSLLGEPACNQQEANKQAWRFLVEGSGIIDAEQFKQAANATIRFTNF